MGRKCGVFECQSDSQRAEDLGVTFHKVPHHSDIRPKWLQLCKIPDDKKVIYVCSRHFLRADFCNFKGKKYMLRQGVLPSIFTWNKTKTRTSKVKEEIDDSDSKNEVIREEAESEETKMDEGEVKGDPNNPLEFKFTPNTRIEALDFNQAWSPATILEVDYEENEVLVHFDSYSNKYDEWIGINSSSIRTLNEDKAKPEKEFEGHPGTSEGLTPSKIEETPKATKQGLFDPVQGTKRDRQIKKRKLNATPLVRKKQKVSDDKWKTGEPWFPTWTDDGTPVGTPSRVLMSDGYRESFIVPDPRVPENWERHVVRRPFGTTMKWDSMIVGPDGKRFRRKTDLTKYLADNPSLNLSEVVFDFSILKPRKKEGGAKSSPAGAASPVHEGVEAETSPPLRTDSLKIIQSDGAFKCPIDGCGKNFRRENLAQMHVKHYHPKYTKYLDSTPNVADLAYARTVGDNLDRSPGVEKKEVKVAKPKAPVKETPTPQKDTEIIKLLNSRPIDGSNPIDTPIDPVPTLPPTYPDFKMKDTFNKFDGIPKPVIQSSGLKTLLPVKREEKVEVKEETIEVPPETSNTIIEGGEVIKIVRMKQEEIINCTCGMTEEDGLMIQCELCLCWQHAYCNNIQRENEVPDKYVCYICQHPARQRNSKKYMHDQDWLKHGNLPTADYHCKDEDGQTRRFDKLKISHDLSGGLLELKEFMQTLKLKLKIAEVKNHPKLYLWSKPWDSYPLPENSETSVDPAESSMLLSLLTKAKNEKITPDFPKIDINSLMENHQTMSAPQPEAPIESADCRLNLLDHITHCQNLVEERLFNFEKQINELDSGLMGDNDENYSRLRHTTNMLLRDLGTLRELSQITTF